MLSASNPTKKEEAVESRNMLPYLCQLPQSLVRWWEALMAVDAVAWNGVGALWGCVTWSHVGWCGSRQRSWVVQGLRLWA